MFQLAEVLVLPRKEGNADRETGTDRSASAGTWLACFESTCIYDSYGVVQSNWAATRETLDRKMDAP